MLMEDKAQEKNDVVDDLKSGSEDEKPDAEVTRWGERIW